MANLPTFVIQYPMSGVRYSENYSYICHADNQQTYFKKVFSHVLCGKCGSFQNRRINEQHSSLYDPKWLCYSCAYTLSYECGVLERLFLFRSYHNLPQDKRNQPHTFLFKHLMREALSSNMTNMVLKYKYYRPAWTCGRYSEHNVSLDKKHVAIMYNLIEGTSNFFEGYSADVIKHVLDVGRNGEVQSDKVSAATGIDIESIDNFFQLLVKNGLLCTHIFSKGEERNYRKAVHANNITKSAITQTTKEKLPLEVSSAEISYFEAVKDEGVVASVMFELTYNCSEKCVHCYNPGATRNDNEQCHRGNREELQLDDYKRIIDELNEAGLVKVCLSGGDPFSKPIVWDIIEYLYQKEIAFDIFTNGQRIVNEVERLADYYPRLVGVSIYSGIAADHDTITRVPGSWEKSMKVVRQFAELGVPMNLKCCIMQPNLHSYYKVTEIARKYGAIPQFELNISDSIDGDQCARQLRLTEEQLQVVLRDSNVPMYVGPEAPNYGGQPRLMDNTPCGAGVSSYCITPDGTVQPCCAHPLSLGNLKKQSMAEIVIGNKTLDAWQHSTLKDYEECGQHDYCDYCNLCPGQAQSQFGDYRKAAENCCFMAKVRHGLAQKMMDGYEPLNGEEFESALLRLPKTIIALHRNYDTKG